ncbi:iron-sulfur-binding ferredoxin reductase [Pseudomonas capeferrum]|uniref:iron-sulfur-binding ferredoxin reductase n=1 Tax=Pseudomonas capeferrum TaxID=1495066 RepID=UPI0015E3A5F3|nr:iron-sulfur-binding ferredoxin reductase [Pseudomonas capeferrum]MBA1202408.1 iron-sulfur-binding ferredoxin reductase [Pseudomonas capeferrum]
MPELCVGARCWTVPMGSNLLDALNEAGVDVPYSCRAGSCHACLVRCLDGMPDDTRPQALASDKREQGWRLACQCRVAQDLRVAVYDPLGDGLAARVCTLEWLGGEVLRLGLRLERPLRYRAGQHVVLWNGSVARPYSLASVPGEDEVLEFHVDCRRPGAFRAGARALRLGDTLQVGELRGGALHYDPDWQQRPLWLLASGTGLAPLWGILREALQQGHQGAIKVVHVAHGEGGHYLAEPLRCLMEMHQGLDLELVTVDEWPRVLPELRLASRQTVVLSCGGMQFVEEVARRLFIAGLPRSQIYSDIFIEKAF